MTKDRRNWAAILLLVGAALGWVRILFVEPTGGWSFLLVILTGAFCFGSLVALATSGERRKRD